MHQPKLLSNLRTALLPIAVVLSLGAAGACTRTPAASATTPPADPGAATAPSAQTLAKAKPNEFWWPDTLDLEPAHGKALDEFVPPCRDVDQFAEPVFAEFHG